MEEVEGIFLKRDDTFTVAGVHGGKARACWSIVGECKPLPKGVVTAGSLHSPQIQILAHISKHLGIPCHAHTSTGKLSEVLEDAKRQGTQIIQHKPGYNSVIIRRAIDDAKKIGYLYVPFGMECVEAVRQTRRQVQSLKNLPIKRIIVPVGSGMSLAGVLWGLKDLKLNIPVLGIVVGADPRRRLRIYAPSSWVSISLIPANVDYSKHIEGAKIGNVELDPVYEAKCLGFLRKGDCLWIVGKRIQ